MEDNSTLFDRKLLRMRRERAAKEWPHYNFLKTEAATRLGDALLDVTRPFDLALDLGCHSRETAEVMKGRVGRVIHCDLAYTMRPDVVCDEEFLPFAPDSVDLVVSVLALHHVNDLLGTLIQIRQCLKPDGMFIAILPGATTLRELRTSVTGASAEYGFPLSPRLSPFVEVRDAGALLQRAGFALPVVDSDTLTVEYDAAFKLLRDVRGMGESNVLRAQSKHFTRHRHLMAITEYYESHFAQGGKVPATVEFITMTGWKPHPSQQQPAKRGSAQMLLKKIL